MEDPAQQAYDRQIGSIIRHYRKLKGLSQADLGGIIQVSFQQVQKYEKGVNRTSAHTLNQIRQALDIPAHLLLDSTDAYTGENTLPRMSTADAKLIAAFLKAPPALRKAIFQLLQSQMEAKNGTEF